MKSTAYKVLLLILLFFCLKVDAQVGEINVYVGKQFLDIPQINEWEHIWDLNPIEGALSTEVSANYYPIKNKNFFIQSGIKYHKIGGQFGPIELAQGSLPPLDEQFVEFRYGFVLRYFILHIAPTVKLNLTKSLNVTFGVGLLTHLVETKQQGFQLDFDPTAIGWTTSQYRAKHSAFGLSYNLSGTISKDLSSKLALSVKIEYNRINTEIGEESPSAFDSENFNESIITVPIHKKNLDLTGLNILVGVSFKLNND